MDKTVIVVSAVVGSLGLLSAILGFAAESTKITISDVRVSGDECLYPQNPSLRLGLCAAVLLLLAQVTVSAIGGCGCCCGNGKPRGIPSSKTNRVVGIVFAVASWIAAVIAVVLFVEGAAWNANVARDTAPVCYFLKDGVFAAAAVLALAATALGVASYVMLRRQLPDDDDDAPAGAVASWRQPLLHSGIAMGHPQFPPHPQWHSQKAKAAAGSGAGTSAGREEPIVVAIKMDKTTIIVSSVVGSLGVLSAILGFAAEAAKFTDCASSLGLAIAATIFLMMAQVTVAAVGGCCGCCKSRAVPSETKRIVGVFAGAGVLVLVATGLGITSFIMLRMHPQAGEAAADRAAPRDYDDDEPTPIGTPIDIHGFRPPMPPNPQVPEPLPNYPPPPYSPAPAPAPAPAEGNGNQLAPDQQLAPHPQGHAQIEAPAAAGLEEPAAVLAIKMDKTTIIVSAVVGSLGLLSAILGFAAEGAKRTKAMIIYVFNFQRCELDLYDLYYSSNSSSAAVGLGVCGAILLVITQVTVAAIGGCCGCCKSRAIPSETKRIVGVVCAVFSWITAVIAFVLFLDGAIVESNCVLVRGGFFASAGVLTLITTALGMTSYFMLRAQPDEPAAPAARRPPGPAGGDEPTPIVGVPTAVPAGFPPPVSSPNPLLVPVPAAQAPPNQQFAHPATSQALPHARFADAAVPDPAPAAAQGYGSQASNQQHFPANPRGRSEVIGSSPALSDAAAGGRRVAAGGSGQWVAGCGTLNSVGCGGRRQRPTQLSRRAAAEAAGESVARAGEGAAGAGTTVVAIKMDKTTIIVSVVVGSLGLLSAILGFAAEGSKLTVTVTAVGGCCGCCKSRAIPSETKRIVGVVCAVISWIAAVIAFVMFLDAGIVASECFIVREGFFAGAGVLALIATALGLTSYIVLRPQPDAAAGRGEPTPIGIPMDAVPGYPPRPPHPPPQQV
uniref:Uncharacterized protein n=1 Tax=Oryza rufipogon TaxID=4529 RepID=A0A0E0NK05_ORYRU